PFAGPGRLPNAPDQTGVSVRTREPSAWWVWCTSREGAGAPGAGRPDAQASTGSGIAEVPGTTQGVTVTALVPVTPWKWASMVVVPAPTAVTRPRLAATFDTVATPVMFEIQVTSSVSSNIDPSLYVPVA